MKGQRGQKDKASLGIDKYQLQSTRVAALCTSPSDLSLLKAVGLLMSEAVRQELKK